MSYEILKKNWEHISKPFYPEERARILRYCTTAAKNESTEAKSKDAGWLSMASEESKKWRLEALNMPETERAINKACHLVYRGLSDIDRIATVHLYQVATGRKKYIDDFITKKWHNEIARAEAWKKGIINREKLSYA